MNSLCGTIIFAALLNCFVPAVTSNCPNGNGRWIQIDCSCFLVTAASTLNLTWKTAEQNCFNTHPLATLAIIKSRKENEILEKHLNGSDSWIAEADSSLPNEENATTECKAIRPSNVWTARDCNQKHRFICTQRFGSGNISALRKGCLTGWKEFNSSCYWLSETALLTFEEARQNCTAMNAKLAEIYTKEEYEFIRNRIFNKNYSSEAWFGLHKAVNATQYKYSQTAIPNYETFGVWFRRQRESSATMQTKYCVTVRIGRNPAIKKNCEQKLHSYICQTQVKRDCNITVMNVKETSANISWSFQPSKCVNRKLFFNLLILKEKFIVKQYSRKISNGNSWLVVNVLKPETQYKIMIAGNNTNECVKPFNTTEIKNRLQSLKDISTRDVYARIGTTVNLLCAARGEPSIKFSWEKDKKTIQSHNETEKPYGSSILSVQLINQTSYGEYICRIKDRFSNISHKILIADLPKDSSDDDKDQDWFVIAIVILAVAVAILVMITSCLVHRLLGLKRKLRTMRKVESVKLKNVSIKNPYDTPVDVEPNRDVSNERPNEPSDNEEERYAALNRAGNDEEDDHYTPLKEVPLYVNTTEFKNTA